jgi:porin
MDSIGRSLADPSSDGRARNHTGSFGFYGIVDQMLWRAPGGEGRGLAGFARLAGAPEDRNLVSLYADAGLTYKGPFERRGNDVAGISFAYAAISDTAAGLDKDARSLTGSGRPVRDYEAVIELTYQMALAPWWIVQPDLQYVFHPGGGAATVDQPDAARIRDAAILGLRTSIKF